MSISRNIIMNAQPCLSRETYNEVGLFICIDFSWQNDDAKTSSIDLRIEIEAANNFPANTAASAYSYTIVLFNKIRLRAKWGKYNLCTYIYTYMYIALIFL